MVDSGMRAPVTVERRRNRMPCCLGAPELGALLLEAFLVGECHTFFESI